MQKDINQNQDTLYQDRLRRSKLILELKENGIWEQIHGTVLNQTNSQSNNLNTEQNQQKKK